MRAKLTRDIVITIPAGSDITVNGPEGKRWFRVPYKHDDLQLDEADFERDAPRTVLGQLPQQGHVYDLVVKSGTRTWSTKTTNLRGYTLESFYEPDWGPKDEVQMDFRKGTTRRRINSRSVVEWIDRTVNPA